MEQDLLLMLLDGQFPGLTLMIRIILIKPIKQCFAFAFMQFKNEQAQLEVLHSEIQVELN